MRIALATVGTLGDVRPFAALAAGLTARGHAVTAISWELHRSELERPGVTFVGSGPPVSEALLRETARAAARERSPMRQVAVLRDFHLLEAAAHLATLRDRLAGQDLAVIHGIHSLAQAAARDAGIRWATAVFDPVLLPTATAPPAGMPNLGPGNRILWALLDRSLRRLERPLDAALRAAGSDAHGLRLFRGRSPLLHLVAVSPRIAPPPADRPPSVHFTGRWNSMTEPIAEPQLEAFLDHGPPPVVVTFGSMAVDDPQRLGAAVAEALEGAGIRAIVQGSLPVSGSGAGRILAAGPTDHAWLFPRASAVVHHGGAGTTHAVVAASVPSVVVPHIGDQPYWAGRLHALGVAPSPLPLSRLTAAGLGERIRIAITDPALRERAAKLGPQVATEDGVSAAIGLLEALA